MSYCWDTSGFIDAWVRSNPPDIFVTLWEKLDGEIQAGNIVSPDEVYQELARQEGDTLLRCVRDRREHLIAPLEDDIQERG